MYSKGIPDIESIKLPIKSFFEKLINFNLFVCLTLQSPLTVNFDASKVQTTERSNYCWILYMQCERWAPGSCLDVEAVKGETSDTLSAYILESLHPNG